MRNNCKEVCKKLLKNKKTIWKIVKHENEVYITIKIKDFVAA